MQLEPHTGIDLRDDAELKFLKDADLELVREE